MQNWEFFPADLKKGMLDMNDKLHIYADSFDVDGITKKFGSATFGLGDTPSKPPQRPATQRQNVCWWIF